MAAISREDIVRTVQEHSVLIEREAIVTLYEASQKMMGFGLAGLLYRAGKSAGKRGAEALAQRLNLQGEDLLEALRIAFNTSRWGEAQLHREQQPWTLEVHDSLLGQSLKSKRPVCHPIAGFWAGFLEAALGREVEVKETECMAQGAAACRFEVHFK